MMISISACLWSLLLALFTSQFLFCKGDANKAVRFTAGQVLKGISANTFYIDYDENIAIMKQAIAQSMNGVEIRNIAAIQIVQCFARGSCNEGEHGNFGQTEKPQNKILVTYTVEVTGALASESALFDQLVLCTKDAVFDDTLHKIARLSAAVDLYQVASGPSVLVKATSSRPRRQLRADLTPEDHVLFSLPAGESTMSSPFQRAHEAASVDIQNVIVVALFALASFFVHAALLNKKSDAPAEGLRQQYTV